MADRPSPSERAIIFAELGRGVRAALHDAIHDQQPDDFETLITYAERVHACATIGNSWYARDLHNRDGDAYDSHGRFWTCTLRLCPFCTSNATKKARAQLRRSIEDQRLKVGEHWHMLTLTVPKIGLGLLDARDVIYRAWTLFRKLDWTNAVIVGAARFEEFTFNASGYHYHMHLIARTKYLHYRQYREFWTQCVKTAYAEAGHHITTLASDGLAVARIDRIHNMQRAMFEVAKYVTKSCTWGDIPASDLLDAARVIRWPRMFAFHGSMSGFSRQLRDDDENTPKERLSLDKGVITDGSSLRGWRAAVKRYGAIGYLRQLFIHIETVEPFRIISLHRHFPVAQFRRIRGPTVPSMDGIIRRVNEMCLLKRDPNRPDTWLMYDAEGTIVRAPQP